MKGPTFLSSENYTTLLQKVMKGLSSLISDGSCKVVETLSEDDEMDLNLKRHFMRKTHHQFCNNANASFVIEVGKYADRRFSHDTKSFQNIRDI